MVFRRADGKSRFRRPPRRVAKPTAKKALRVANKALHQNAPEMKHLDVTSTVTLDLAAAIIGLNEMQQGLTDITRIGNKIQAKSLEFRAIMKHNASSTVSAQIRVMIVKDKQANGADFAITDLLENSLVISLRNPHIKNRFVVYYDRVYTLQPSDEARFIKTFIRLPDGPQSRISYQTNLGTIADVEQNNYALVVMSDTSANDPTIVHENRLNFTDA